jgi:hypothetical protein
MGMKLFSQRSLGQDRAGENHEAARFLVEALDDAQAGQGTFAAFSFPLSDQPWNNVFQRG